MTAACFKRKAWDGSPITCYCPVYRAERYMIGSSDCAQDSCAPNLPYIARCRASRGRSGQFTRWPAARSLWRAVLAAHFARSGCVSHAVVWMPPPLV